MLRVFLGPVAERCAWVLCRPTRQNAIIVHRLLVVRIVDRCHIVHVRVKQVVQVPGLPVAHKVGQVKLVVNRQRVQQAAEERIDAVPGAELLPALVFDLADGAEEFEVLDDVTVEP